MNTAKEIKKRNSSAKNKEMNKNKCKKSGNDKLNMNIPKNLLLAYTYFLNDKHTCKVIIGFSAETFEAQIIFHRFKDIPVYISFNEWEKYFTNFKQLDKKRCADETQLLQDLLESIDVKTTITTKVIVNFTLKNDNSNNNNNKIFPMFQNEYQHFLNIIEFLNVVMCYNNTASANVREYFNKYMEKCKAKNLFQLSFDEYYIPMNLSHVHCNYSRLFFEIPLYCSGKLFENLITSLNIEM